MSLSLNKHNLCKYSNNNYFFETGTFSAGGVQIAINCGFKNVISIEVYEKFQLDNIEKFRGLDHVKLYIGDSEAIMWDLIKDIDESITFFLDSHTMPHTGNAMGIREIPLLQEIDIIAKHPIKTHTIMIDDRRLFGYSGHAPMPISKGWDSILEQSIIEKLLTINPNYKIVYEDTSNATRDILVAHV
jgi:hypothetical protein